VRVAVLGTGALGCVFAARLAAVAETWMLGSWAEGIAAVRARGVVVHEGDSTWRAPVSAVDDPAQAPQADLALVLTKSYQTPRAAQWARAVLARGGLALTLQNGLDNVPRLAEVLGTERVIAGITFEGATLLGPGEVRHAGRGLTCLGAPPESGQGVHSWTDLLRRAGFDAQAAPHIDGLLWGKAVVNAAINPLTALWRVTNGDLLSGERRELLAALVDEAASVAGACGINLPYDDAVRRAEEVCRATAGNRSSMLQDVERGRRTEIDSINGVIVAAGRRQGVSAPLNDLVWRLVRAL
jgi:2-dehydropantoate 2-reductase